MPAVRIYTLSTCVHCKAAKRLLEQCAVNYEFTDVDLLQGDERRAVLDDVKRINANCTFPTIIIGGRVIVGFDEQAIREALGL